MSKNTKKQGVSAEGTKDPTGAGGWYPTRPGQLAGTAERRREGKQEGKGKGERKKKGKGKKRGEGKRKEGDRGLEHINYLLLFGHFPLAAGRPASRKKFNRKYD